MQRTPLLRSLRGAHDAWDRDRILRLAAEAVINRIGDAAAKLPNEVQSAMSAVPSNDIRANRILVAHIYHRIDPAVLWATISRDIPRLAGEVVRWRALEHSRRAQPEKEVGRDTGLGMGL